MSDRYPGYDVLAKRSSQSWNEQTRRVIDERLAIDPEAHGFFTDVEWLILKAVCARIVPQPPDRSRPVPLAAMIDQKLTANATDGYRDARLPPLREAWRRGLHALDAEARVLKHGSFGELNALEQDAVLTAVRDLRRFGLPPRRRRQSLAHHPGDRLSHGRPDQGPCGAKGVLAEPR
jgi:Gluconate 2-dehydrogenase subunit 3